MKKRFLASVLVLAMAAGMTACGSTTASNTASTGKTYKVGIVNYVDDASLNQIVENIEIGRASCRERV